MGFAKGHATSETGSIANYGCQTQLGYQGNLSILSFVLNHLSSNSLKDFQIPLNFPDYVEITRHYNNHLCH